MRNALITCLWIVVSLSACKLDTRVTATGVAPAAPECPNGVACDSGTPNSSTRADATPTQPSDIKPVMTGQTDPSTNAGNVGGMSGGPAGGAAVKPPPLPKKPDGEICDANTDCVSGHCLHNICCTGGDCCRKAADCPSNIIDGQQVACNEPSTCQGKRGEIRCENFLCIADGDVPDDSACTVEHLAQDCSPYTPVFCNGKTEQEAPPCPTSCANDTACIEEAHCDAISGTCVMDVEDGGDCSVNRDCASSHCNRNLCCAAGDCCRDETQCLLYNSLPKCVDEETCTGSQKLAECKSNQCSNVEMSSPSGCNTIIVERCGLYPDISCRNGVRARCATSCRVDSQCKLEAYCRQTSQGGVCERKLRDGEACTSTAQCQTTCNHGFCCNDSNPDTYCCGTSDDCRMLAKNECVPEPNSCDGRRIEATCNPEHRCRTNPVPDPNACSNRSIDCGPAYRGPAACPLGCGCGNNQDCAEGFICIKQGSATRGICQLDPNIGGAGAGGGTP